MAYNINKAKELLEKIINNKKEGKLILEAELTEVQKLLDTTKTIYIAWGVEDILDRAEERNLEITDDIAQNILYRMDHRHDCEYGITWTTIDVYLDELEEEGNEQIGKF